MLRKGTVKISCNSPTSTSNQQAAHLEGIPPILTYIAQTLVKITQLNVDCLLLHWRFT